MGELSFQPVVRSIRPASPNDAVGIPSGKRPAVTEFLIQNDPALLKFVLVALHIEGGQVTERQRGRRAHPQSQTTQIPVFEILAQVLSRETQGLTESKEYDDSFPHVGDLSRKLDPMRLPHPPPGNFFENVYIQVFPCLDLQPTPQCVTHYYSASF